MPTSTLSRSLNLSGATNFRDLGGYLGKDGRPVRWRRLFRSDNLAGLSAQDLAVLAELRLSRSFDFRGVNERATAAYELPGVVQHSLSIEPTVVQSLRALMDTGERLNEHDAVALMQQTYRAFVHDNSSRFGELFSHLLDSDAPLVFHCTAGKDRTGFVVAMLLAALRVPRDDILDDYLESGRRQPPEALAQRLLAMSPMRPSANELAAIETIASVRPEFLVTALDTAERGHGSLERYLDACGVDAALREALGGALLD